MILNELKELLMIVSSYETGPYSLGKTSCIALVVNDFFGRKILRCDTSIGRHYYNLVNGEIIDIAKDLLIEDIDNYDNSQESVRDNILANIDLKKRYERLLYNLKQAKRQHDGKKFKLIDVIEY